MPSERAIASSTTSAAWPASSTPRADRLVRRSRAELARQLARGRGERVGASRDVGRGQVDALGGAAHRLGGSSCGDANEEAGEDRARRSPSRARSAFSSRSPPLYGSPPITTPSRARAGDPRPRAPSKLLRRPGRSAPSPAIPDAAAAGPRCRKGSMTQLPSQARRRPRRPAARTRGRARGRSAGIGQRDALQRPRRPTTRK